MKIKKTRLFLKLFFSTLTLSAFTFGGGYVIVPLMKKKFTDTLGWLDGDEMLELVALAQSSPGAIAVNCAVLVGYRTAGASGALIALLGTAIPPFVILSAVSFLYGAIRDNSLVASAMRGMQAGIAAVIADVVFGMAKDFFRKDRVPSLAIMAAAFTAVRFFEINAALIIIACAALGAIGAIVSGRSEKGGEEH